jgi:hypothetical protein
MTEDRELGTGSHPPSAGDPKLCGSMGEMKTTTNARRIAVALALAALCAALIGAIGISSAGARKAAVLGKTKHTPGPSCGDRKHPKDCSVVGRTTGYMTIADGKKHPYNIFKDGKIVAWAIDVSKPLEKKYGQRTFFGTLFGNDKLGKGPTARLAVLKRKAKHKFKLKHQSTTVDLRSVLGHKETFTLDKPLRVRKGDVVALSYPTWAPNFNSHDFNPSISVDGNQWRASRKKDNCAPKKDTDRAKRRFARASHAHEKVGSTRSYDCLYKGGRLLYWAYFVPNK